MGVEILCGWCVQCVYMYVKDSCVGIDCTQYGGGGCVLDEKCKTVWFVGARDKDGQSVKLWQFLAQLTCSLSQAENRLSSRSPLGVRSITWMAWGSPTSGSGGRRLTHIARFTASSWRVRGK